MFHFSCHVLNMKLQRLWEIDACNHLHLLPSFFFVYGVGQRPCQSCILQASANHAIIWITILNFIVGYRGACPMFIFDRDYLKESTEFLYFGELFVSVKLYQQPLYAISVSSIWAPRVRGVHILWGINCMYIYIYIYSGWKCVGHIYCETSII